MQTFILEYSGVVFEWRAAICWGINVLNVSILYALIENFHYTAWGLIQGHTSRDKTSEWAY